MVNICRLFCSEIGWVFLWVLIANNFRPQGQVFNGLASFFIYVVRFDVLVTWNFCRLTDSHKLILIGNLVPLHRFFNLPTKVSKIFPEEICFYSDAWFLQNTLQMRSSFGEIQSNNNQAPRVRLHISRHVKIMPKFATELTQPHRFIPVP